MLYTACGPNMTVVSENDQPVVLYGAVWRCMVLCGAVWCCVVRYGALWCRLVLYGAVWCFVVLSPLHGDV